MTALQLNKFLTELSNAKWLKLIGVLVGCVGIAYLGWKFVKLWGYDIDFKYIWLSGKLWSVGESPYSSQFQQQGQILFEVFNDSPFFYPPNWWIVSTFFGQFEYQSAVDLWRCINIGLLISSSFLLRAGMRQAGTNLSWTYLIFYTGLVSLMQATSISLAFGQTAILMYFGVCLIIYATLSHKQLWLVVGFCLILLKPHIGIALMTAYAPFKIYRTPLIFTSVATAIISLPALLSNGIINTIISYLDGLSKYDEDIVNNPQSSSGLKNVFHLITNIQLSGLFVTFLTILCVFVSIMFLKRRGLSISAKVGTDKHIVLLMLSICISGVLMPLHSYDTIFIAPIILLAARFEGMSQWIFSILFLFILRSDNLATATGFYSSGAVYGFGGLIISLAVSSMLILVVIEALRITDKTHNKLPPVTGNDIIKS